MTFTPPTPGLSLLKKGSSLDQISIICKLLQKSVKKKEKLGYKVELFLYVKGKNESPLFKAQLIFITQVRGDSRIRGEIKF